MWGTVVSDDVLSEQRMNHVYHEGTRAVSWYDEHATKQTELCCQSLTAKWAEGKNAGQMKRQVTPEIT